MFEVKIPGFGELKIEHIVFDLNGTLVVDGVLSDETAYLASLLKEIYGLKYTLITAATRGIPEEIAEKIGAEINVINGDEAIAKEEYIKNLGKERVCAIGNGANDALMLKTAALGICVLGEEGASKEAIINSDLVVRSIEDALRLFLHPKRMIATLRR